MPRGSSRGGWPFREASMRARKIPPQLHQENDRVDRKVSPFVDRQEIMDFAREFGLAPTLFQYTGKTGNKKQAGF
jgi:hypothetical protein